MVSALRLRSDAVEATERFADLVSERHFPLDEAALLIARHGDPGCDIDAALAALDELAAAVEEPTLDSLTRTLFVGRGFQGDHADYYDPRNSYLHEVLARRRGIPITLSVVLMETGRRAGVPLEGVGTPAHFLTRTITAPVVYVDAFAGGRRMDRTELEGFFARVAPGIDVEPYLGALEPVQIVRRILGNLAGVHRQRHDRDSLLWTTRLRTLLPGASAEDQRSYAGALAACGDFVQAAKVLESVVAAGDAADPDRELGQARSLRARLN